MKIHHTMILLLGCLAACSGSPKIDEHSKKMEPLTSSVILMGDNQEHHLAGLPTPATINSVWDRGLTEVTIRPPQQSLFGRKLLEAVVQNNPGIPLVHLGDLLDVSCRQEWDRVSSMILRPNIAIAHGNHDGIAHGIFNSLTGGAKNEVMLYSAKGWKLECLNPYVYKGLRPVKKTYDDKDFANIFTSADFIDRYVKNKAALTLLPVRTKFEYSPGGLLEKMIGFVEPESDCIDKEGCKKYTSSYLLQQVALPSAGKSKVSMLVMDTSQVDSKFSVRLNMSIWSNPISTLLAFKKENPGSMGYLLDDQLAEIEKIVLSTPADDVLVFAGHHHWESLNPDVRKKLSAIFVKRVNQPIIYFSAHTHEGFMRSHDLRSGRTLTEVNINSLADWPIGMREMTMQMAEDRSRIRVKLLVKLDSVSDSLTSQFAGKNGDQLNQTMALAWEQACVGSGVISKSAFDSQIRLTERHREGGQSYRHAKELFYGYRKNPNDLRMRHLLYEDALNGLEYAKDVVGKAAKDLPGFGQRMQAYLSTDSRSICHGMTLDRCLSQKVVLPAWEDRHKDPKDYYYPLAEVYSAAQRAIDEATEANESSYMKCAFIASAISDHVAARAADPKKDDRIMNNFRVESIDARL